MDIGGSTLLLGASTPENVARLNSDQRLGLTSDELRALPQKKTIVKSGRFGVMMHGSLDVPTPPASVKVFDDTVFDTGETVFLDKAVAANISVDGAKGAQLNPRNGVIVQMIDSDDPGPITVNGAMLNQGVYHEPTGAPARVSGFDVAAPHTSDLVASFANITLKGDFYNAFRDGVATKMGVRSAPSGKNLIVKFENAHVTGVISAATSKHAKSDIGSADYMLLGEVTNTVSPAINNGVVLSLTSSSWTITGTSYLTNLTIGDGSTIAAPAGSKVTMTVDGKAVPVKCGSYTGNIVLSVNKA